LNGRGPKIGGASVARTPYFRLLFANCVSPKMVILLGYNDANALAIRYPCQEKERIKMSKDLKVNDGHVVSMDYTLKVDGEVADTSDGREPLEYVHGAGNIIPGLEREMTGMTVGESKDVVVTAADAYGEEDEKAFMDVPRDQFPEEIPMRVGTEIQVQDQSGQPMRARIETVGDKSVRLDFNHPLAGKDLHFAVTVVGLREATDEEKAHGHVHKPGHPH
jgi:FKBP-type peptidyl-prolyl cis-trans isomerase SlyD